MKRYTIIFPAALLLLGCQTAAEHHASLPQPQERETTVGTVQREIHVGMNSTEVLKVLGSPNIVTKSKNGETWVFDKFSTETAYSRSSGGISVLVLGGGVIGGSAVVGGGIGPSYGQSAGASSTTQRTLTVIIELVDNKVHSFDYHSSRF